jgi:hybrid cluster-associated redox disulfide protein
LPINGDGLAEKASGQAVELVLTKYWLYNTQTGVGGEGMITKEMTIAEVLTRSPQTAVVFSLAGMDCLDCPTARAESIEDAAEAYDVDVDELIQQRNRTGDKPNFEAGNVYAFACFCFSGGSLFMPASRFLARSFCGWEP